MLVLSFPPPHIRCHCSLSWSFVFLFSARVNCAGAFFLLLTCSPRTLLIPIFPWIIPGRASPTLPHPCLFLIALSLPPGRCLFPHFSRGLPSHRCLPSPARLNPPDEGPETLSLTFLSMVWIFPLFCPWRTYFHRVLTVLPRTQLGLAPFFHCTLLFFPVCWMILVFSVFVFAASLCPPCRLTPFPLEVTCP